MVSSYSVTDFSRLHGLTELFTDSERSESLSPSYYVDPLVSDPYPPEWIDLNRLFALIRLRRVTTVLEFGCGFSTVVMAHALSLNEDEFSSEIGVRLRRSDPFQLHVVDDMPHYIELAKARLSSGLSERCHFLATQVSMTTFNGRICTQYERIPNVCPDLIFLDAPGQYNTVGEVSGISTRHPDRTPMACDVLKIEHFLLPGTLLVVDGRTSNARFLRTNLQREWRYEHDSRDEVHYFEMVEEPLGEWNRRQIEFCLGTDWRERPLTPEYDRVTSGGTAN